LAIEFLRTTNPKPQKPIRKPVSFFANAVIQIAYHADCSMVMVKKKQTAIKEEMGTNWAQWGKCLVFGNLLTSVEVKVRAYFYEHIFLHP